MMNSNFVILLINFIFIRICLSELNNKQIEEILNEHNRYRQLIAKGLISGQPPAANMLKMTWNEESAEKAQRKANTCEFSHDSKKERSYGQHEWVGQNIAMSSRRGISNGIKLWFDEVKGFSYFDNNCSINSCGHYTQVIWAKSKEIGCGISRCKHGRFSITFLVCNYGPGGNFDNELPYKSGHACSKCISGTTCYNGLCH